MADCERCGIGEATIPWKFDDDFGEEHEIRVCHDCDWDLMNGGDAQDGEYEIWEDRIEQEYAEDPINNPPPWIFMK